LNIIFLNKLRTFIQVELSHLPDMYEPKAVVPRTAKLYTKQEYSEKFILILEGRAMVTIGQAEMTFEAGPWHAFGTEMLEHLVARNEVDPRLQRLGFVPDYSVVVRDDCTFLEITAHDWVAAYRSTLMSRGETRYSLLISTNFLLEFFVDVGK
uniref:Cyclic nucleotide-binding domain-containing protein n=1 Tax=Angiostrongylus cantonensis TaxID=6313 RepID=A0A0K0D772_ANGCA